MYLHIGLNYLINTKHIVGIFDIENTSGSLLTRRFLAEAQNRYEIISVTEELPKSFIIYNEKGKTTVYLTQFSTVTLQKRNIVNNLNI
ncbi:MAG: hypothetical protein K0S55_352 [Clostridia bacterium]|nr:hypothetical protein [Clostridia bacterium]